MHNTKGLEFDRVIISGMEEGLFPGRANETDEDIEEERRIFYVSITRAKHQLYFTACRQRSIWGHSSYQTPSRFLRELPMEYIQIEGTPPFGSGFVSGSGSGAFQSQSRGKLPKHTSPRYHAGDEKQSKAASSAAYAAGDRVYHDQYGSGYITESSMENGREMVTVRFDTGKPAKFISKYARLEKIAQD